VSPLTPSTPVPSPRKARDRHASDAELLARVAARDRQAGAAFFDRYGGEIFGFLARRIGVTDAEDALQEVFVRALRRASTFRGEASLRTWLYSIARYVVIERNRSRVAVESIAELIESGPDPESLALRGEARRQLVAALEQLPDEQAIVLELHRIDGLSHDQIAALLEIKPSASRKRLQRATAALREVFAEPALPADHSRLESWRASLLRRTLPGEECHDSSA